MTHTQIHTHTHTQRRRRMLGCQKEFTVTRVKAEWRDNQHEGKRRNGGSGDERKGNGLTSEGLPKP